jgi:hypothetical protein
MHIGAAQLLLGVALPEAVSRVITEKWEATSREAGIPATGPSAAEATGTLAMASATERKRGGV